MFLSEKVKNFSMLEIVSQHFSFLIYSPLSLDILKTFCTVSNDSFLAVNSSNLKSAGYFELI